MKLKVKYTGSYGTVVPMTQPPFLFSFTKKQREKKKLKSNHQKEKKIWWKLPCKSIMKCKHSIKCLSGNKCCFPLTLSLSQEQFPPSCFNSQLKHPNMFYLLLISSGFEYFFFRSLSAYSFKSHWFACTFKMCAYNLFLLSFTGYTSDFKMLVRSTNVGSFTFNSSKCIKC